MRYLLASCITSLLLPAMCDAQTAQMPGPSELEIGDTWRWQQADDRTNVKERPTFLTVVGSRGEKMLSNGASEFRLSDYYVDGSYPLPGADKKTVAQPWRSWPLEVGKKWTFDMDWVRPDGVTGHTHQDVEVAALEEVEVPAGKFMAYRIVHRGFFSNSNNIRGQQDDTYWYAPDVKADVKLRRDDRYNVYTRELVSFTHRATDAAHVSLAGPSNPDDSGRSYFDQARLSATLIGKAVRMRRYADGATMTFSFNRDGSATRERESVRNRVTSGTWEFSDGLLCMHLGADNPCFGFFEQDGVVKVGPRGQDARWEVIHVE